VTVAKNVDSSVPKDCGHFFPEERPEEIVRHVQALKPRAPPPDAEDAALATRLWAESEKIVQAL
jgi:hypothetical protein